MLILKLCFQNFSGSHNLDEELCQTKHPARVSEPENLGKGDKPCPDIPEAFDAVKFEILCVSGDKVWW